MGAGIESNFKLGGYNHSWHDFIEPVHTSFLTGWYCSEQGSQLGKTGDDSLFSPLKLT